jgi:hypothetical protein
VIQQTIEHNRLGLRPSHDFAKSVQDMNLLVHLLGCDSAYGGDTYVKWLKHAQDRILDEKLYNLVNNPILFGLLCIHKEIAFDVFFNF